MKRDELFRLMVVGPEGVREFCDCEYLSHVHGIDGLELRFGRFAQDGNRLPEMRIAAESWQYYQLTKQSA